MSTRLFTAARTLILLVAAASGLAQGHPDDEKVIIPLYAKDSGVPGAYGSRFVTELYARNDSPNFVRVDTWGRCELASCRLVPLEAMTTRQLFPAEEYTVYPVSVFLYLRRPGNESISFNLRVQDLSRQSLTWGTELPVVREKDVFRTRVSLLNVPVAERFRQALRIYDYDFDSSQVRIRMYAQATDALLVDDTVTLRALVSKETPALVFINDLVQRYPSLVSTDRVRIAIDPVTPNMRFWAFVSVTNNETQHITLITPQ